MCEAGDPGARPDAQAAAQAVLPVPARGGDAPMPVPGQVTGCVACARYAERDRQAMAAYRWLQERDVSDERGVDAMLRSAAMTETEWRNALTALRR